MLSTNATSSAADATTADARDRPADSAAQEALRRGQRRLPVWQWFDGRERSEAFGGGLSRPLDAGAGEALLGGLWRSAKADRPRVIYVHVPFCSAICTFCAFFRQASAKDAVVTAYVDALCREIERISGTSWAHARPFEAVYFGGGTPTTIAAPQLSRVLSTLRRLPLAEDCEITVESRVDGLGENDLRRLVEAGVNRLSIGVQSFETDVRRGVNRLADRAGVVACLEGARAAGLTNISVDLIYNLPGQSDQTWARSLATLGQTPATGCSVYTLIPQTKSVLGRQLERGEATLGGLADEYRYHRAAVSHFQQRADWQRFSSVHYGRRGRETHRYNGVRGRDVDVLGLGAGAGWRMADLTGSNVPNVGRYIDHANRGTSSVDRIARRSPEALAHASLFALIDGPGASFEQFVRQLPAWRDDLRALTDLGLIQRAGDWCRLSADGCFWAYNIGSLLGQAIQRQAETDA